MRINLNCPFEDRAAVKALGARWDLTLKVWYVIDPPDLLPFARWLPLDVAQFLATGGTKHQAKAAPKTAHKAKPKKQKAKARSRVPLTSQGTPYQGPDSIVADTNPAEPPW